mmetsp:Transcript_26306/g.30311  ORF Transcript_26306/g.30311 Transcript_26306/m.30311 type:complete len:379 (+) Transcript_26306:3-1139(+)
MGGFLGGTGCRTFGGFLGGFAGGTFGGFTGGFLGGFVRRIGCRFLRGKIRRTACRCIGGIGGGGYGRGSSSGRSGRSGRQSGCDGCGWCDYQDGYRCWYFSFGFFFLSHHVIGKHLPHRITVGVAVANTPTVLGYPKGILQELTGLLCSNVDLDQLVRGKGGHQVSYLLGLEQIPRLEFGVGLPRPSGEGGPEINVDKPLAQVLPLVDGLDPLFWIPHVEDEGGSRELLVDFMEVGPLWEIHPRFHLPVNFRIQGKAVHPIKGILVIAKIYQHLVPAALPSDGTIIDVGIAIVVREEFLILLQQAALEIPKHRCGPGLHHPHDDDWRTGIIDECRDAHGVFSCDLRLFSVSFHVAAGCWSHIIGRRRVSHLGRRHRHR